MQFFHDRGTLHFDVRFGPAPASERNKAGIWNLRVISMVSCTLVFCLNKAISACSSKEMSAMVTPSSDDGCDRILTEPAICGSVERSDSSDALCGSLLLAKFTVQTFSASTVLTVRLPMAQVDVMCSACLRVVRALVAVLESARLAADIRSSSADLAATSSSCSALRGDSLPKVTRVKRGFCLTISLH